MTDNTQSMNLKGLTSVKYSGQMPGGNSNFSLGGDYGGSDDRFANSGKPNAAPIQGKNEEAKQEEPTPIIQNQ